MTAQLPMATNINAGTRCSTLCHIRGQNGNVKLTHQLKLLQKELHLLSYNKKRSILLSGDFIFPMHGALFSDSPRPESFMSVMETLRDAATLAIDENLGGDLFKSVQDLDRKKIMDR